MQQPMGFRDLNHPNDVCLLKKSLYGPKQSPRARYKRFTNYVSTLGFSHNIFYHSLFIYQQGITMAYLLLYVDDIILTTSFDVIHKSIIYLFSSEFAMKDLGLLSYFLGIVVTRYAGGLFLSQQKYATKIIERADMLSCKPFPTLVDTQPKLNANSSTPYANPSHY